MNTIDSFHDHSPGPNWQILGELELPIGVSMDDAIHAWLMELLSPLNLYEDILNKIRMSAQNVTTRIPQVETRMKFEHIHLTVYVPANLTSKGQSWGFFRVERIINATTDVTVPDHAIDFYLYLEG